MNEKSSAPTLPTLHRDWIDEDAIQIVRSLQERGFESYLVGGCVRDLLVGVHPKDFDIVTSAQPEDVRKIIRRAYIIGRRFRLVLVRRGEKIFEVATYRRDFSPEEFPDGAPAGDNVFGTPEEDARRRDFTLNGLFYDPIRDKLVDYIYGISDIEARVIRMIGSPEVRLREDPIRILRALRLAHKLKFQIDPELRAGMQAHASSLASSVLPRKREEYLKLLRLPNAECAFVEASDLGIIPHILPSLQPILEDHDKASELSVYLNRFAQLPVDTSQAVFLFGALILSVFRLLHEPDPHAHWRPESILNKDSMNRLMVEELGMFKSEVAVVTRALGMQSIMSRGEEFWRKGQRRRAAILRDEAFPLALMMAEMDCTMSQADLQRWQDGFQEAYRAF